MHDFGLEDLYPLKDIDPRVAAVHSLMNQGKTLSPYDNKQLEGIYNKREAPTGGND